MLIKSISEIRPEQTYLRMFVCEYNVVHILQKALTWLAGL